MQCSDDFQIVDLFFQNMCHYHNVALLSSDIESIEFMPVTHTKLNQSFTKRHYHLIKTKDMMRLSSQLTDGSDELIEVSCITSGTRSISVTHCMQVD